MILPASAVTLTWTRNSSRPWPGPCPGRTSPPLAAPASPLVPRGQDRPGKVVGAVMVVGGGIAGIQAALDLADSGYYVYLVEKSPGIGGKMSQLDKTYPTNDCAM